MSFLSHVRRHIRDPEEEEEDSSPHMYIRVAAILSRVTLGIIILE
jgi:hypothetical protein